jgi:hypothetical protein
LKSLPFDLQKQDEELIDLKQAPVWGCNDFIRAMELILMDNTVLPAAYDLSALSPKPVSQIQLHCTKPAATPTPSAAPGRM